MNHLGFPNIGVVVSVIFISVVPCHSQRPIMKMSDVYEAKITSILGDEVQLVTGVTWENYLPGCTLEGDSCPTDIFFASSLVIEFEEGDRFVSHEEFRGQGRGDIGVVSDEIETRLDGTKTEQYFFRKRPLLKGVVYDLIGEFHYRYHPWTKESSTQPPIDSLALRQHNDVTYWSQLFEFRLKEIAGFDATSVQSATYGSLKSLVNGYMEGR